MDNVEGKFAKEKPGAASLRQSLSPRPQRRMVLKTIGLRTIRLKTAGLRTLGFRVIGLNPGVWGGLLEGLERWRPAVTKTVLPVAALVAAGIVLHILTSVNLLALLWQGLGGGAAFFGQGVTVPFWLVAALGMTSLFSLSLTAWRLFAARQAAKRAGNPYVGDHLFGVDWQWRWNGQTPDLSSLTPLCPHCADELALWGRPAPRADQAQSFSGDEVTLRCERCEASHRFDGGSSELLERIAKEIRRRARLGARA